MHLISSNIFLCAAFFCFGVNTTLPTKEDLEVTNIKKEIEEELEKYLKHFASIDASEEERSNLIMKGLRGTPEFFGFNVSSKPFLADVSLDCKIKKLAFEFAEKLRVDQGALKSVFNGLELGALCNQSFPPNLHRDVKNILKSAHSDNEQKDSVSFFVESNINIESHEHRKSDGSINDPLFSIHEGLANCNRILENTNEKCFIYLRKGVHQIEKPLLITKSNIVIKSYNNENAVITSDRQINTNWKLYQKELITFEGLNPLFEGIKPKQSTHSVSFVGVFNNSNQCKDYCETETSCTAFAYFDNTCGDFNNHCYVRNDGKWNPMKHAGVTGGKKIVIYKADLKELGLQKVDQVFVNGRRAVRARFPNANPENMGLHTIPSGYVGRALKWLPPHQTDPALEIQINAPVRDASIFPTFGIGIGGPVSQFDPPQSYWGTKNPVGGGGATYKVPSGLQYSEELEIHLRSWKNASTGIVHAFHNGHWGNWMFKLDSRNEENQTLHWTYGGFQEARGASGGAEWYVENIFEELDVAEEWFYDEVSSVLYYSPNNTASGLPTQVSIPQMPSLVRVIGSQDNPVVNFHLSGVTLLHSTQTFLERYMVPSGGDWSVHRNGAVYLEGTVNATVDGCIFDSPGGNGMFVSNFNRGTFISNNVMYRSGDNGIVVVGDTHLIDGSDGNQPRGVHVVHNIIFNNGIWGKQAYPYVQSRACETLLEGNVFFNGPRAGVNINDGFGGSNVIQNNLLFNFVRETDDHGPINTWDRVPYLTKVYDGKLSLNVGENQIHQNFIINNYRSVWPIDHDDGSSFWNDTHNFLVYGGFKNYLGHDLHSMYNVYVYPGYGVESSPCMSTMGQQTGKSGYLDVYSHNKCIMTSSNIYTLGSCTPVYMRELIPYLTSNQYFTKSGTVTANCGGNIWNLHQFQMRGMDIGSTVGGLLEDDVIIGWGRDLLGL